MNSEETVINTMSKASKTQKESVINMMYCKVNDNSFSISNDPSINGDLLNDLNDLNDLNGNIGDLKNHQITPWKPDQNIKKDYSLTCWNWWTDYYYPHVIKESYPVYIKEKSYDVGKKAYEIIKVLRDKELIKVKEVKDFVKLMDELIKLL